MVSRSRKQVQRLKNFKAKADNRFGHYSRFVQFAIIGGAGTLVNLAVLTLALWTGFSTRTSLFLGIFVSLNSNFILNRKITFAGYRRDSVARQYFLYLVANALGNIINFQVSNWLTLKTLWGAEVPQLAALVGILCGMFFNFGLSRIFVFRSER